MDGARHHYSHLIRCFCYRAISVISTQSGRRSSASDLALAEDLAYRAALAVDNARLYGESQEAEAQILQYASRLQLLVDASRSFAEVKSSFKEAFPIPQELLLKSASPELETVLDPICQRLSKLMGDSGAIQMLSLDQKWLSSIAIHHSKPEILALMKEMLTDSQPADAEPFRQVIQTGETLLGIGYLGLNITSLFPYTLSSPTCLFQLQGLIAQMVQKRVIGAIGLWRHNAENQYTLHDRVFLQEIADRVASTFINE